MVDAIQPSESLSTLEHDLLLSYIRDLYEIATVEMDSKVETAPKQARESIEVPQPIVEKIDSKPVEKQVETIHVQPPAVAPSESASVPIVVPSMSAPEPVAHKIAPVQTTVIEHPIVQPVQEKIVSKPAMTSDDDAVLKELFADDAITDLSDKLASTHIPDLKKSMGINEKIFTQQELFNNNATLMTETLEALNDMTTFQDARAYLVQNLVYSQNWLSEHKIKKAATFVKLVKRHFV